MPTKKNMTIEQITHLRGDTIFTHKCVSCEEPKTASAFPANSKGVCNVCKIRAQQQDQEFVIKRRKLAYEKELRAIYRDYPLERELA